MDVKSAQNYQLNTLESNPSAVQASTVKPDGLVNNAKASDLFNQIKDHIKIEGVKPIFPIDKISFFNSGPEMVDATVKAIMTGSQAEDISATVKFVEDLQSLTHGELEETRDYIAKKIAGEDNSEVRAVLAELYNIVDREAESNKIRPVPWKRFPIEPTPQRPIPLNPVKPFYVPANISDMEQLVNKTTT